MIAFSLAGTGAEGVFGRGRGHFRGPRGGYQRGSGGSVSQFRMPPANHHFDLVNIGQADDPMENILDYLIPAYEVQKVKEEAPKIPEESKDTDEDWTVLDQTSPNIRDVGAFIYIYKKKSK